MNSVTLPNDVQVIWQLELPVVPRNHAYFEVPDLKTLDRLQIALAKSGLPLARLLPQYRRKEGDQVVALGACLCHSDDITPTVTWERIQRCTSEASLPIQFLPVSSLARYFCIPIVGKRLFADFYHWDPWQHQWRLQEVNSILLRYGLPARKKLTLADGSRILCILGIWKKPGGSHVTVRYAIASADGERAHTCDISFDQSHEVLVCLSAGSEVAVIVHVDDMLECETWKFPTFQFNRKPTNTVLHKEIVPWVPTAKLSVSSLGNRRTGGRRQVFRLIRVPVRPEEFEARQAGLVRSCVWKSWNEVVDAFERGILDPATEIMVNRIQHRYERPEELFEVV